ncbi:uncharacterized protein IL334_007750 [Kwoniella shivajii]|uniref:Uncharacterized protein n=1 Tax=Kwoniella shivajii TaxID=564305 RepID=A0ABZ1D9I8_9TREE|nr:hypothetical protein IL334_007750 [Kwoniella shivajii]
MSFDTSRREEPAILPTFPAKGSGPTLNTINDEDISSSLHPSPQTTFKTFLGNGSYLPSSIRRRIVLLNRWYSHSSSVILMMAQERSFYKL